MVRGGIGKFLSDDVRSITRKERGDRRLELCVGALDVFLVVVLIADTLVSLATLMRCCVGWSVMMLMTPAMASEP